jgi:hypothetical protein
VTFRPAGAVDLPAIVRLLAGDPGRTREQGAGPDAIRCYERLNFHSHAGMKLDLG